MTQKITRHYTTIQGLQIHYRKAGEGRPVILFHQSPRSSAEYEDLMKEWAGEFTVIAPDTPGFGYSDPLPMGESSMMDFAQVMAEFIISLGVGKVGIYGFHTGASLGACVASLIPDHLAIAIIHGLAKLFPQEKNDFLQNYFPPFTPKWDGSHLTWVWARIREQSIFFPWYKKDPENRLLMNVYSAQKMEQQIQDFLLSGDEYRKAYAAAFSLEPDLILKSIQTPLRVIGAPPDPLFEHLDRLKDYSPHCKLVAFDNPDQAKMAAFSYLKEADFTGACVKDTAFQTSWVTGRNFVNLEDNNIHFSDRGEEGNLPPLLVLPDLMGSISTLSDEIQFLGKNRRVIAFDLPGHGGSDALYDHKNKSLEEVAAVISQAVKKMGFQECEILAFGFSAYIAKLIQKNLGNVKRITAVDLFLPKGDQSADFVSQFLPDLTANDWGGHLLSGWHFSRCRHMFWPWFAPLSENIIKSGNIQDVTSLHHSFVALWQSDRTLVKAILRDIFEIHNPSGSSLFSDCDRVFLPEWCRSRPDIEYSTDQTKFYSSDYEQQLTAAFSQEIGDYHV